MLFILSAVILGGQPPKITLNDSEPVMTENNRLYPEDQAKVDAFLRKGVNAVERKPFRPLRLVLVLLVVITSFSVLSLYLASTIGL